jgi:coproporphyrinogen III oxidase
VEGILMSLPPLAKWKWYGQRTNNP